MLVRRVLPCQRWPLRMWEFNPEGPRTILHFFGLTLKGMCKLFFGPQVKCPDTAEDAGLSCNRLDAQVSNLKAGHFIYIYHDYEGIARWANGEWKANKEKTQAYQQFIKESREKIQIIFVKVAAHTGVKYNEQADQLAKKALGIL